MQCKHHVTTANYVQAGPGACTPRRPSVCLASPRTALNKAKK